MTVPAVAMSAFLGRSLIVNGHQCRICWTGHVSNAVLFVMLLARSRLSRSDRYSVRELEIYPAQ